MGAELLSELLLSNTNLVELTEKETEKKVDSFDDDHKDKILVSNFIVQHLIASKTHQYLEFSTTLPNIYLQQIELPPDQA
jgi:hypothetical protein